MTNTTTIGRRLYAWSAPIAAAMIFGLLSTPAFAIPAGWTCEGACGTLGADGDVTLPPGPPGATTYDWISTAGGDSGVGVIDSEAGSATNGSLLTSSVFGAAVGDSLQFFFNFVTSDGAGFADYAWAALVNQATLEVTYLVTARTQTDGSIIPGVGLPAIDATLTPPSVPIIDGAPVWSPLGASSGLCYIAVGNGCGYTGWVTSDFSILTAGSYVLQFGVTNWLDTAFDTGLAISGATIDGEIIEEVPEPGTLALLGIGLLGLGMSRRRRKI